MIQAIIFDCWNTLFYTDLVPSPFAEFAERIGENIRDHSYLEIFEKHFMLENHYKLEVPIKELLVELNINPSEKLVAELKCILEKGKDLKKAYPETLDVLKALKEKYKLGLITNTYYPGFKILEEKFELNKYFDVILKSYETKILKPNPKIFGLMLKRLGLKKNEVLMVGDSLRADVQAAEKYGIKAILIDRENRRPEYSRRITSLEQLPQFL